MDGDSLKLIKKLADEERGLGQFIAPSVSSEYVIIKRSAVYRLKNNRPDFEGWGLFEAKGRNAIFLKNADDFDVIDYLDCLPTINLILCTKVKGKTWLAFPENLESFKKRTGKSDPVLVHLVSDGSAFAKIHSGFDGTNFFYKSPVTSLDRLDTETLFKLLNEYIEPEKLVLKYLTPEYRIAYSLIYAQMEDNNPAKLAEKKLLEVAKLGGAKIRHYRDHGEYFVVDWTDTLGYKRTSSIAKNMQVISPGFCLSGEDKKFDFHSLIGIVEKSPDWWRH